MLERSQVENGLQKSMPGRFSFIGIQHCMAMQQAMKQIPLSRMSGFDVCVLTIEVEEGHTRGQEHDDGDDGDDDGDNGAGGRLLPLPSPQAARPSRIPSTTTKRECIPRQNRRLNHQSQSKNSLLPPIFIWP